MPQLNGTLPSSLTRITTLSVSYNPYLYGPYLTGKVPSAAACGAQLAGTSINLDRSFVDILSEANPILDPLQYVLTPGGWNMTAGLQPCPPYAGQVNPQRINYGGSWIGVVCTDSAVNGGPSNLNLNTLRYRLAGSLPVVLRELRTLTSLILTTNALTGAHARSLCPQPSPLSSDCLIPILLQAKCPPTGSRPSSGTISPLTTALGPSPTSAWTVRLALRTSLPRIRSLSHPGDFTSFESLLSAARARCREHAVGDDPRVALQPGHRSAWDARLAVFEYVQRDYRLVICGFHARNWDRVQPAARWHHTERRACRYSVRPERGDGVHPARHFHRARPPDGGHPGRRRQRAGPWPAAPLRLGRPTAVRSARGPGHAIELASVRRGRVHRGHLLAIWWNQLHRADQPGALGHPASAGALARSPRRSPRASCSIFDITIFY